MKNFACGLKGAFAVVTLSFFVVTILTGCAKKIPHTLIPAYDKKQVRLIAVLPVEDQTNHPEVGKILRQEILDALYFKQYPKIPLSLVDEKINAFYPGVKNPNPQTMPPRDAGGILGVHAVMYITLNECSSRCLIWLAQSTIAARFQLYDVRTGELLWSTQYRATDREFNIVRDWLKMDAVALYSDLIEEIVKKVMNTLPDGPGL
ncbi:MAG TPA: DUF799 family lipoprotein [Syntrophales bacterium]|nr:DUF799 family lipoprotein [Syntrophales bacterium]HOL59969.1 DUF799 family lipoprotein [Syntrophales bacterium]HPO36118.1 DUF799 family lipoprotein [Syntrophales bacterium]